MSIHLLSEVEGTGTLKNEETEAQINGSLHIRCLLEPRCVPRFKFYPHSVDPIELSKFSRHRKEIDPAFTIVEAATVGGETIRIKGIHYLSSHVSTYEREQNFLEFKANDVLIGEEKAVSGIKFYIPNLEFWGTEWSIFSNKIKRLDKSTVQSGDYLIEIRQILNYRDVISELQSAQDKVAVTSTVAITLKPEGSTLDVTDTIELMDIFNELLNLAMGRFVFWPKCEGYQGSKLVWQKLRSVRLHPFGPRLGFVDFRSDPRAIRQFIASSFDGFNKWFSKDKTIGRRILHSYLWGLNSPLLETQIYSLSYALEVLVARFLDRDEITYYIHNKRELLNKFKEFVAEEVIPKIVEEEKADEFRGNKLDGRIGGFFRRSFRDLITELLKKSQKDHYNNIWNEWIKDFVEARNCVVHHSDEKSPEELFWAWCKGLELIELIFLGNNWVATEHHQSKIDLFS